MDLNKMLDKWQPRLGLTDWDIEIRFANSDELGEDCACAKYIETIQHAKLKILCKEDRIESNPMHRDIELDVIHELVHIRLWSIDPMGIDGVHNTCREQAIEWIAKGLVYSDRSTKE